MAVSPPKPIDFPLNALRAFEAAARLGGFSAAAVELGVTPGAVAAHVKQLEEMLGAPLFQRVAKGVRLTVLGQKALPQLTLAFDAMSMASRVLRDEAPPKTVHIATLPALAQLWLSPRLPDLRKSAPEISVSITAMEEPPNLKRSPYDLCLFYAETGGTLIESDEIFPVCAPAVAARLQRVQDLNHATCLSDATWSGDWDRWLSAAGLSAAIGPRGPVFSLYALAVEEAVNGAGVLMGHGALVRRHLADGRLVAPFDLRVPMHAGVRLWSNAVMRRDGGAARVARWLQANAA